MSCEAKQEQLSLLIDAELQEPDQVGLFRHLEGCSDCRLFFRSMIRLRNAAKRDQEEIALTADEILPPWDPAAVQRSSRGRSRWIEIVSGGWRMPKPVAIGVAIVLIAGGIVLGSRIASTGGSGAAGDRIAKPAVVVVCSLPEVEVVQRDPGRQGGSPR